MTQIQIKMAKSSPGELEMMLKFFEGLEQIFEGDFERSPYGDYEAEQQEAIAKYVSKCWEGSLSSSWSRFYWGFSTLLDNAADPRKSHLAWKPEIERMLKLPEYVTRDNNGRDIATHKPDCGSLDRGSRDHMRVSICTCGFHDMAHFGKDMEG